MHDAVVIILKALAGGLLVVLFSIIGHAVHPKWFAGLFAAAPSVAIASLIVTVADKGDHVASTSAFGMTFGAVGFVAFAALARPLLARMDATRASAFACLLWTAVAVGGYFLVRV